MNKRSSAEAEFSHRGNTSSSSGTDGQQPLIAELAIRHDRGNDSPSHEFNGKKSKKSKSNKKQGSGSKVREAAEPRQGVFDFDASAMQ